ncbi:uncharacterized protein EV420DRAFT_1758794 [Desarmillaria tabescens]|uniref:Uncharacterized protein n=1 Tax=Armillaria tabescens TaxID=1929756 RepID=A0AA39NJZ1_ARMTA|nr:uncharacterized protein EV420DRAFT_1758794 [Desarmillaria tabescens]KAK0466883.1 hypothetical protein EV420DRAFT_1758794 [Desarmillaria tabescens]
MITNNQLIQTTGYLFAIAIAMALSVTVFVKDILALITFHTPSAATPEYPRIAVMVKVEVTTTQYSMIEPSSSVFSDSTLIEVSSECYSGARLALNHTKFETLSADGSGQKGGPASIHGPSSPQLVASSSIRLYRVSRGGREVKVWRCTRGEEAPINYLVRA